MTLNINHSSYSFHQQPIHRQIPKCQSNKQSCPVTLHNSTQVSFDQPLRKFSMFDLTSKISDQSNKMTMSESSKMSMDESSKINSGIVSNKINIDQVMVDIKLTPLKSNEFSDRIKLIYQSLNYIKNLSPSLLQQVRTAQLIMENIQNKFNRQYAETKRSRQQSLNQSQKELFYQRQSLSQQQQLQSKHSIISSTKKQQQPSFLILSKKKPTPTNTTSVCNNDISPIKHLDQPTSRIFYTNFTIKQIQNSCRKESTHKKSTQHHHSQSVTKNTLNHHQSISKSNKKVTLPNQSQSNKNIIQQSFSKCKSVHKKTDSGFTVSNFDAEDEQMERLTKNIQALDRVLQLKGLCIKNDIENRNKTAGLKESNSNSFKQSFLKSQKKPLMFNSKQRPVSSNKQNW